MLLNLTTLVYKELEGNEVPISKEMLLEYYKDMGCYTFHSAVSKQY